MSKGAEMARVNDTYRSFRSTGERLSKCKVGSFKIAFQLPTPCCEKRNEKVSTRYPTRCKREERRRRPTRLQPSTSIWVSSMVHFLRAFFSGGAGLVRRRTLPRRSSDGEGRPVSSRNLKAGTSLSEAGVARETRRCLVAEEEGKGAVNEKVEVCVPIVVAIIWNELSE
jgi:hypothetical protein